MRSVSIIGIGQTKFGEHWDQGFRDLIVEAGVKAVIDANLQGKEIQAIYGGSMANGHLIGQEHIGALIADQLGLNPIPSVRCEAACASGAVALRSGYLDVASGAHDVVAVGGAEKMTDVSTEDVAMGLGGAGDQEWELFNGATFPSIFALMARRHMFEYGTTEEQLALVAVKNHANAVHNPYAQYQKAITIQDVMESGYVASPLKLLDCSPITDGAAALILCATEKAKQYSNKPIEILASVQTSDTLALAQRQSITESKATQFAMQDVLKQAQVTREQIDVLECHDCFTINQLIALESLGFCEKGKAGKFIEEGNIDNGGKIPTNMSGGLKAVGHPVGATGVREAIDIVRQLRGEMHEKTQVKDAEIGLTHNVGGSGATVVLHVLKRGF
ncbi:MAG: thiolase domain-containing protein [Candidatus Micrarchaeota archaeon]